MAKRKASPPTDGGSNTGKPIAVGGTKSGAAIGGKAYSGPGKRFAPSSIKQPNTNLTNTYGITNQSANVKSGVTGPNTVTDRNLPDNQGVLTAKVSRYTR